SMPNGLYGWSAGQLTISMYSVELPSGPQNRGTGAARPWDLRLLKLINVRNVTLSVRSYSALPKMLTRSFGVTSCLYGRYVNRPGRSSAWKSPLVGSPGSHPAGLTPSGTTSKNCSASQPTLGSQNTKRPAGMPELT